jgi:hypothetical protein
LELLELLELLEPLGPLEPWEWEFGTEEAPRYQLRAVSVLS